MICFSHQSTPGTGEPGSQEDTRPQSSKDQVRGYRAMGAVIVKQLQQTSLWAFGRKGWGANEIISWDGHQAVSGAKMSLFMGKFNIKSWGP